MTFMNEAISPTDAPRRGYPLVAWLVILAVVGVILWRNGEKSGGGRADWLVPMQMKGRYFVGAANSGLSSQKADFYKEAKKEFDNDPQEKRLRFAILAGELSGPEEARRVLGGLHGTGEELPHQEETTRIL